MPTTVPQRTDNTWPVLAFLRFVFATLVAFWHLYVFIPTPPLFHILAPFVYAGVPGFFLISGYSIAHSVTLQPKGFYKRRIQRLYPVYLFALALACVPYCVYGRSFFAGSYEVHAPTSVWTWVGNLFFLQGIVCLPLKTFSPSWTLAIEVAFYVMAPLLARTSTRTLVWLILGSVCLYLNQSILGVVHNVSSLYGVGIPILAWNWLAGFVLYRQKDNDLMRVFIIALCAMIMSVTAVNGESYSIAAFVGSYSVALFGVTAAILGCVHKIDLTPSVTRWLKKWGTYLGDLSYPLYLVHIPIYCWILGSRQENTPPSLSSYIVLALAYVAAIIAFHLVDLPYRRFAQRRNPGQQSRPTAF